MCTHCGCSATAQPTLTHLSNPALGVYEWMPPQPRTFVRAPAPETVHLHQPILAKNDSLAAHNRCGFEAQQILALNLVSSPGSGKTTLLVRTLTDLRGQIAISVIEGDQETDHDARRIRATGAAVVQINTGTGCHLDADMLARGIEQLQPPARSIVMIENVATSSALPCSTWASAARWRSARSPKARTSRSSTRTCFELPSSCSSTRSTCCRT
jgi:hydrogenase nickel incorporation protein HypB